MLAFIILFLLAYVALWFLLSGIYKALGKFTNKIIRDSINIMIEEDKDKDEKGDLKKYE